MITKREELPTNYSQGETTLRELILKFHISAQYILSKWLMVSAFCILGGVVGFSYAFFEKPEYTATTTFVLENGDGISGSMSQYAGIASMVGIDIGGGGGIFQGDNIIELYKSRTMIEKALLSCINKESGELLIDRYIKFNELKKKWDKKPLLKNIKFNIDSPFLGSKLQSSIKEDRLRDSIIRDIFTDINKNYLSVVKPDKRLSIIKVDVKAKDELFAMALNEELVKNVNEFYIQTKTKKSLANVAILSHKVDSVLRVMNGAIYSAAIVNDITPNLNLTRQVQRIAPMQRSQFTAETNKVLLTELIKNLELSKLSLLKETPLIQVIDKPILPLEKSQLSTVFSIIKGAFIFGVLIIGYLLLKKIPKF